MDNWVYFKQTRPI